VGFPRHVEAAPLYLWSIQMINRTQSDTCVEPPFLYWLALPDKLSIHSIHSISTALFHLFFVIEYTVTMVSEHHVREWIAGTVGGWAQVLVGHPFDTVKVSELVQGWDSAYTGHFGECFML
jgi:hypothetical protein